MKTLVPIQIKKVRKQERKQRKSAPYKKMISPRLPKEYTLDELMNYYFI